MIRHLVALRFKPDVSAADKEALYAQLAALDGHIDGILDFQHRRNVSVEGPLVRGYRDLFWFDFRDTGVRDAYLKTQRTRPSAPKSWPGWKAARRVFSCLISRCRARQPWRLLTQAWAHPRATIPWTSRPSRIPRGWDARTKPDSVAAARPCACRQ